jgi:uncharacterized protein YbaR (Trm112 family)
MGDAMIAKELLDILVCPDCKVPVSLNSSQSGLACPQCKRLFPIQDDIPIMLLDKARKME